MATNISLTNIDATLLTTLQSVKFGKLAVLGITYYVNLIQTKLTF